VDRVTLANSAFARTALRIWSGAIVWAAHFTAIYSFAALACARGYARATALGLDVVTLVVFVATLLAFVATVAISHRALHDEATFENWLTASVAALAALAIVWEGFVPVFMMPPCG
jgi:uncharacterized membrane protein YhaH (DUF805 family)